jgi:UDP-glucose 4-epimerase
MNILVTGGAGFIGANLTRLLLAEGHAVRVLDNFGTGRRAYLDGLNLEIVAGDIVDAERVARAVEGIDGVVHLAAQTGVPGSLADPRRDCQTNVIGTLNVLEACRRASVRRFVFASSNAVLGRQPPPATEDKAPLPISPYGASKLAGEGYCLAYHGSWGLGTVALRFANVYGPYSAHKSSVVSQFFKDILAERDLTVDGDGQQTRDFVYVGDICCAIQLALESDAGGEIFQVATGQETSILALARLVQEVIGRPVETHHGPARQGDIHRNYSAMGKVEKMLGWKPETGLRAGLQEMWGWFCRHRERIER